MSKAWGVIWHMLNLTYSVKALQSVIHFFFQKLEMGFPICEESEKQLLLTHSQNFHRQENLEQAMLICSPAVNILFEIEDQHDKQYEVKESRASIEVKVQYCLVKSSVKALSVKRVL